MNNLKKKIIWLKRQLMLDDLTGAWNRRYLFRRLDLNKYQGGYLYFIDLDNFRYINKKYGHIAADQLLVGFVADIKKCLSDGVVIRYGGDEFVVVSKNSFVFKSDLDFSYGVVQISNCNLITLLEKADKEMYKNKHSIIV